MIDRSQARRFRSVIAALAFTASWSFGATALADELKLALSGDQEIPPVATQGSGTATLSVSPDGMISGSVTVSGMKPTVAHIHEAPPGKNGPIVIPLARTSDAIWTVPPGTRLTDAQMQSYRQGNLYFNVHSEANRAGEIRGQIKP